MGPTSAGKTTIGKLFVDHIRTAGTPAIHFDGNEVRDFFGSSLGFRQEDRLRAVSTCAYLANKSAEAGLNVVVSALTANDDARQFVRKNVHNLVLSYLKCPKEVCFERDALGLYRMAREGKVDSDTVIGFDSPYVPPSDPDIVLDTAVLSPDESVESLKTYLKNTGYNFP